MARRFATTEPAGFFEHLQNIAIAHLGPPKLQAHVLNRLLQCQIGHECAHHATQGCHTHLLGPLLDDREQQFVTVEDPALPVTHDNAVAIAIQCYPIVSPKPLHQLHHGLRSSRTDVFVDVEAIGLVAHGNHFRAQLMKNVGRHMIGRPMGSIDHQTKASQAEPKWKGALAEFDVATGRIVQATGLAQHVRICADQWTVERGLDLELNRIGQLLAMAIEKLDAVVFKRVVRGADHDACGQPQRLGQIGNRRSRHGPCQDNIDASTGKSGL